METSDLWKCQITVIQFYFDNFLLPTEMEGKKKEEEKKNTLQDFYFKWESEFCFSILCLHLS